MLSGSSGLDTLKFQQASALSPDALTPTNGGEGMTTQRTLLTAEEFFHLYSHLEGDFELVKGEVIEMAPPEGA